jgi:hypothetical protein
MSWNNWIKKNTTDRDIDYDRLLELVVSSYNLDKKTRKMGQKDRVQFVLVWWNQNKDKFRKYNTTTRVGALLNIGHATVIHHYAYRKMSSIYEEETKCIKDFIES